MKYEYKILYFQTTQWSKTGLPSDLGEHFDRLGNEGWELVRTEPLLKPGVFGSYTSGIVAFFKKPKE